MLIVTAPIDFVLGLTLGGYPSNSPINISLKCWVVFFIKKAIYLILCTLFSPHYILIILTFLNWFSVKTSANLPITIACFAVNFSWILKKYVVNRFPSRPWQDFFFFLVEGSMGYESLTEFSINQSIIIYFAVHKCTDRLHLFWFSQKIAHAHISGRQNKNKLKEKHVESSEPLVSRVPTTLYISFISADFEKNMPDSCTAFGCTNRRSTTSLQFYRIPSAKRYPEQRIAKWVTAKSDRLRK